MDQHYVELLQRVDALISRIEVGIVLSLLTNNIFENELNFLWTMVLVRKKTNVGQTIIFKHQLKNYTNNLKSFDCAFDHSRMISKSFV